MNPRKILELRTNIFGICHYVLMDENTQVIMTSETYFSRSNAVRAIMSTATALDLKWRERIPKVARG